MKPYPHNSSSASLCLLFLLAAPSSGCTSTETGNPAKESPGPGTPLEGTPLDLELGLRGAALGVNNPSGVITGLWLQVSEVEFVTCAGQSTASRGLNTEENLTMRQELPVIAPDEPICAIVVRTTPLDVSGNQNVPPAGAGQGAVVEGIDLAGSAFSAVVPERVTSVLIPVSSSLTLAAAETLRLTIEDELLLQPISTYGDAGAPAQPDPAQPNVYDSSNAPDLVDAMATQLNVAFSLERITTSPEEPEILATSTTTWSEVDDLLCASECALQDRTACSTTSCDVQTCVTQLMDPVCGESFRNALHCRVGMSPGEYSCVDGTLSVVDSHCALPDSTYGSCGGP